MKNHPSLSATISALLLLFALPASVLLGSSLCLGWLMSRISHFDLFQASMLCLIALAVCTVHFLRTAREIAAVPLPCPCGCEEEDIPLDPDAHAEGATAAGDHYIAGNGQILSVVLPDRAGRAHRRRRDSN
jgi:hypothetical protein